MEMKKLMMSLLVGTSALVAGSANADVATPGEIMQVAKIGAPFCPTAEAMAAALIEAITTKGNSSKAYGCGMASPGIKVLVLDVLGEDPSSELSGVKIRYLRGGVQEEAYTFALGLSEVKDSSPSQGKKTSKRRSR
jgi:hypothetical protein